MNVQILIEYLLKFLTQQNAALAISTGAAGDLFSRICIAILSLFIHVKPRNLFLAATIGIIVTRFGEFQKKAFVQAFYRIILYTFLVFLKVTSFVGVLSVVAVLGILRAFLHVTTSLSLAEYLSQERSV